MSTTVGDFKALDDDPDEVNVAEQWPPLVRALYGLAAVFQGKVSFGDEPDDVLNGLYLGDAGAGRKFDWRVYADGSGNIKFDRNVGLPETPTWTTRLTVSPTLGIGDYAAVVHSHSASDIATGTIADARISQSSVDQHAVSTPAASRIVKAKSDGKIDEAWINQAAVDQSATATPTANRVPKADGAGKLAVGWISQAAVDQHAVVAGTANRVPLGNGSAKLADTWISESSVLQHSAAMAASISGMERISSLTLAGNTSFSWVGLTMANYSELQIRGKFKLSVAAFFFSRTDANGGASYDSGASDYSWYQDSHQEGVATSTPVTDSIDSAIYLGQTAVPDEYVTLSVDIFGLGSSGYDYFNMRYEFHSLGGGSLSARGRARRIGTVVNAIIFFPNNSATIDGYATLYGRRK